MTIRSTDDKTFQVGVTYATRSACDHDCIFTAEITRRTAKSVWVRDRHGRETRRAVSVGFNGEEIFYPFGKYSMAAVMTAGRRLA